jgi:hypothetical protein
MRVALGKRSIQRYPQGLGGGCFTPATFWMQPKTPINELSSPQNLVRLLANYQTHPIYVDVAAWIPC